MSYSKTTTLKGRTPQFYGAIDLGTQNCRLMIAQHNQGQFTINEAFSHIVCLGEGVARTQKLSKAAMDRAITSLQYCAKKINTYGDIAYLAVTTAAARNASNAAQFLKRVERETGIQLHIITPAQEALFAGIGSLPLVHPKAQKAVIFDIGGGSTELVIFNLENPSAPTLIDSISMPYGVVTMGESMAQAALLKETFKTYAATVQAVQNATTAFALKNDLLAEESLQLIGTSGTTTTVAALHLNLRLYDRDKIEGLALRLEDLERTIRFVHSMTPHERLMHPCIGQSKSDLILGGLAIFQGIFSVWPSLAVTVTDRGVRDGIVQALAHYEQYERWFNGYSPHYKAP